MNGNIVLAVLAIFSMGVLVDNTVMGGVCPYGSELTGYNCGRTTDHQDCPTGFTCVISSLDTYAVCCPNYCGSFIQPLNGIFCGRGPTHQDCPNKFTCVISPTDLFAVCCPKRRILG